MSNAARELLESIWRTLERATTQRTGFTRAVVATVTADDQPRARFVIVRDFAVDPERIAFATDVRSSKIAELRDNPQVELVFYDEANSVQCRVEGVATIVTDEVTRQRAWQRLAPHTQHTYASAAGDETDDRTAFERFAWVSIEIQALDWLDLSTQPHQRWQFQRRGTSWAGQRVNP